MAIHPAFPSADPSAISIGPSRVAQEKKVEKSPQIEQQVQADNTQPKKKKGFSFFDILDVINPLQHIPVISSVYRHFTGDDIKPVARVAGGALFGGPIGAAVSGADVLIAQQTGDYVGDTIVAGLFGGSKSTTSAPAPAAAEALETVRDEEFIIPETVVANASNPNIDERITFFEDGFFDDLRTSAEEADHPSRLALARENYLKSINLVEAKTPSVSNLF